MVFLLFILATSLWGFKTRHLPFFNESISYTDVMLVLFSFVLFGLAFKGIKNTMLVDRSSRYFYFIIIYCFITLIWSDQKASMWYTSYQLILAFLSIFIPHYLSKLSNDKHLNTEKFMSNFAIVMTTIFFIYYLGRMDGERLGGYFAGAALIGFAMIPVSAIHFNNIMTKKRILISSLAFIITVFCIFMTQSRMALITFVLYIVVTFLRKPTLTRIALMSIVGLTSYYMFADKINTFRYGNLTSDDYRSQMLDTAINWGTKDGFSLIFGNGYGSIWQWAAYLQGDLTWGPEKFLYTEHGPIMHHAHSVFNQLFAEIGLIGTIPFFLFVILLIREALKSWKRKEEFRLNLLIAIICTIPATFSDLIVFANWQVTLVWFFFAFVAISYKEDSNTNKFINNKKKYRLVWK